MEVTASSVLLSLALATFLTFARKAVIWVWLRPKQLERALRDQGFKGNPYRFLYGDSKEFVSVTKAARSKPMEANDDDIVPRVLPSHQYFGNLHGTNYFAWMGPTPKVIITDPKLIKEIFSNSGVFQKPVPKPLFKLFVTGILTYNGEKWATHRSLVTPAFHLEKLKLMVPAMYSSCCEMISQWEVLVPEKGSCELDVWPYLSNLTAEVISRTAFGSDYEEGKQICQLQRLQIDNLLQSMGLMHIPGWRFVPTKTNRKMKRIYNDVGALVRNMINKRQQTMNGGDNDLLGILLNSNLKATGQEHESKSIKLTVEDIIEECKLFYFAGQETTSVLLVWTMVLLSKHQKWQALAREEVLAVFGDDKPDFDGLHQLKTVTMILNEVMRLYPPVPYFARYVDKNTKLGGLVLPAGIEIMLPTIAVHHDPENWGQDSKIFKPERFSEGIVKATKGQSTFFPFSGGPRICLGQNFALVEAKLALAMILKRFHFQLSPSYKHAPTLMFTIQPQYGAHLTLQKIL